MEDRDERGPLPARGDVGGAKVVDDGQPDAASEGGAIADLDGEPAIRRVEHGLAVEAHDRGGDALVGGVGRKGLDHGAMGLRHEPFGGGDRARPLLAAGDGTGLAERGAQQVALGGFVRAEQGRAEGGDGLSVRQHQRGVDAVERGAAHQAERPERFEGCHGANPLVNSPSRPARERPVASGSGALPRRAATRRP